MPLETIFNFSFIVHQNILFTNDNGILRSAQNDTVAILWWVYHTP